MENVHTDIWGCEELLSKFKSKFMLLYFVYDRLFIFTGHLWRRWSWQHTAHFLHIKNSFRGDFADKE